MHAIKRSTLAPFVTAAAILFTAVPAAGIVTSMASSAAAATHSGPQAALLRDCPAGTNWDVQTQSCR